MPRIEVELGPVRQIEAHQQLRLMRRIDRLEQPAAEITAVRIQLQPVRQVRVGAGHTHPGSRLNGGVHLIPGRHIVQTVAEANGDRPPVRLLRAQVVVVIPEQLKPPGEAGSRRASIPGLVGDELFRT